MGSGNCYISLHKVVLAATALDPRMKKLDPVMNENDRELTFKYVQEMMEEFLQGADKCHVQATTTTPADKEADVDDDDDEAHGFFADMEGQDQDDDAEMTEDLGASVDDTIEVCSAKLTRYRNMAVIPLKQDPLAWWEENRHKLPNLYNLAQRLLSITATSGPSERLWSIAAKIITKDRARLDSELVVAALIFLKENGALLAKSAPAIEERVGICLPTVYELVLPEDETANVLQKLDEDKD